MARTFKLDSPLGDRLLFARLSGSEGLGELFQYQLTALSERADVRPAELLGQRLTVSMDLGEGRERHFSGHVTAMHRSVDAERGRTRYELTLRPWLWFLTRTSDCRIFQDMTVPEILAAVFEDEASQRVELRLSGAYRSWSYCVQYRETDFNFVSRLMEQEGIYYYFEHSADGHVMVLCDAPGAHVPIEGGESVRYVRTADARVDEDAITGVEDRVQVEPGRYAMTEYDFRSPGSSLAVMRQPALPIEHAKADYEVFDYPGEYDAAAEGDDYAGVRIEEARARAEVFEFTGTERDAATGRRFKLGGHPRRGFNLEYLIVATQFSAEESHYGSTDDAGTSWSMSFTAIRNQQSWRPLRATPKPVIQGVQTAVVTGPAGEEIHTDKFGRIRVQFHWDRYGRRDEKSSCWVRVAYPIAGKGWGMVAVPRIGHEVVVSFEEGDPDRPLVIGSVYNGDNPAPFGAEGRPTVSGMRSNTHKGKGFNAMTMDDTAGKEKIDIHAQHDMHTKVGHDQTNTVDNTFTETIKQDAKITVTEGTYSHDVAANSATYHVKGALQETYEATQTTTVTGDLSITSKEGTVSITASAKNLVIKAETEILIQVGESKLLMKKDGTISLEGKDVTIKGSSSVNIKGMAVRSHADQEHEIKGAIVKSVGSATNTVKGGMVMLNPAG
jgi:type VI secretion system secreted protein VgrG